MSGLRALARAEGLGRAGRFLLERTRPHIKPDIADADLQYWWDEVQRVRLVDEVGAAGVSLLYCQYPVQVDIGVGAMLELCNLILEPLPERDDPLKVLGNGAFNFRFRLKAGQGATNKVNTFASEVVPELRRSWPRLHDQLVQVSAHLRVLTDDQVCSVALYAAGASGDVRKAVEIAVRAIHDPGGAKVLSTVIKSLGLNGTSTGAKLCELNTLLGRGVGDVDLVAEAERRCIKELAEDTVVNVDPEALREKVRGIIERELGGSAVDFEDPEEFWSRRWAWCVNGAHSRQLERAEPIWAVDSTLGRIHRRVFAENTSINPLVEWSGVSYFTASVKLEPGKKRALFAGDSATYVCFEHLLRPVEMAWRNRRCILDPGRGGFCGMIERVRKLQRGAPVNVLLDYDDFNSQHSTRSMQVVFEELIRIVGYDEPLGSKLVKSFERGRVFVDGVDMGYSHGTLMSGHRATTFINTVLNEAYLALVIDNFDGLVSMHVGDDVYIGASSFSAAAQIVTQVGQSPFRLQPIKQSVGSYTCEFLRTAIGRDGAYGYLARSVAAIVNGNWVNEVKLGSMDALKSMVGNSWTLMARSQSHQVYRLLVPSVVRMTRLSRATVEEFLSCKTALNDGPCLRSATRASRWIVRQVQSARESANLRKYGSKATDAYMCEHVSPVEASALMMVDGSVKNVMLAASYKKTLAEQAPHGSQDELAVASGRSFILGQAVTVSEALGMTAKTGCLAKYPLIQLVKNNLTEADLRYLVELAAGDNYATDIKAEAFGSESHGVIVDGWLPYSDACALGNRVSADVLRVTYPVMA